MGSQTVSKKWLVTGASQGLGLAITMSALKAGRKVLACARDKDKAVKEHPEVEKAGGKWLKLDVTSPDTEKVVLEAVEAFGGIDVVVNNAACFLSGTIEDVLEEEMQTVISTNYLGPIRVLKAVLPTMRAQNSGTLVLNSGIFGMYPLPGGAIYSSINAAINMIYETINIELAPFNIRTITLNIGSHRTNVLRNGKQPKNGIGQHYLEKTPIGAVFGIMGSVIQDPEKIPGDPVKFGDRVVEIVDGTGYGKGLEKNARFVIGRDAFAIAEKKLEVLGGEVKASQRIAASIDVEGCTAPGMISVLDVTTNS